MISFYFSIITISCCCSQSNKTTRYNDETKYTFLSFKIVQSSFVLVQNENNNCTSVTTSISKEPENILKCKLHHLF